MSKSYDPFKRGDFAVGVRSTAWTDASRSRTLPIEIYYPADASYIGQDTDPATQDAFVPPAAFSDMALKKQAAVRDARANIGDHPVVIFAHGYAGDRRESSFLCTHLASHGYRVISADHVGSTFEDVERQLSDADFKRRFFVGDMLKARYGDVPFMLDAAEREFDTTITDAGVTGVSLGGWTAYIAPGCDARVRAIAPLCPGGAEGPLTLNGPNTLGDGFRWDWKAPASVLTLVADRDTWLPLYGQLRTFEECRSNDKQMVIMKRADHMHFCDDLEASHEGLRVFTRQLADTDKDSTAPPWRAMADMMEPYTRLMQQNEMYKLVGGLVTFQMDAKLKRLATPAKWDRQELARQLRAQSVNAYLPQF